MTRTAAPAVLAFLLPGRSGVSRDGRLVVFGAAAATLLRGDGNGYRDIIDATAFRGVVGERAPSRAVSCAPPPRASSPEGAAHQRLVARWSDEHSAPSVVPLGRPTLERDVPREDRVLERVQ